MGRVDERKWRSRASIYARNAWLRSEVEPLSGSQMARKVCPLLLIAKKQVICLKEDSQYQVTLEECLEEDCAWWDEDSRACCLLSLSGLLRSLVGLLLTKK